MTEDEIKAVADEIAKHMPNPAHIEALLGDDDRGHAGWWRWRQDNPEIVPRLAGLAAQNRSLQEIALHGAVLSDAKLRHADLYKADFSGASCGNADFRNARLMHASFVGANLWLAALNHCDA